MTQPIVPTEKGRTKQSQEKSWSDVRKKFEAYAEQFPEDHISTHLTRLRELDISRKDPTHFYRTRDLVKPLGQQILDGVSEPLTNAFYFPNVTAGEYYPTTISPIRHLMNSVRSDTTVIVEFGSGWSCNLMQLYVGLGTTRSRSIDYHGAEYTDEGQQTALRMAEYDGNINYFAHSFDYRSPDLSFLEKYDGHILAFTRHSIEQVDVISPKLYEDLSNLKADVTLVHFEPVGWQRDHSLMSKRKSDDRKFFEAVGDRVKMGGDVSGDPKQNQIENAAWWSWRLKYNTNLYSIVNAFEVLGKVSVKRKVFDFSAVGNVLNPTTMFHLEFLKQKADLLPKEQISEKDGLANDNAGIEQDV